MELPSVGRHCALESCKLLDYLPFKCHWCSLTFCRDHASHESHFCDKFVDEDRILPQCPLCSQYVSFAFSENPDENVDRHIRAGCPRTDLEAKKPQHRCTHVDDKGKQCKTTVIAPVVCPGCHQNFCLRHRIDMDHNCPKRAGVSAPPPRAVVASAPAPLDGGSRLGGISTGVSRLVSAFATAFSPASAPAPAPVAQVAAPVAAPRTPSPPAVTTTTSTAPAPMEIAAPAPVAVAVPKKLPPATLRDLRRLAKGRGAVAEEKRVYLIVRLPLERGSVALPMYFSEDWTMGKVLDVCADLAAVVNNNNRDPTHRLQLFDGLTGHAFPLSSRLSACGLKSGSLVVLERTPAEFDRLPEDLLRAHGLPLVAVH